MTAKVFIDGEAGTTGLQILERLTAREDITLVQVEHERRKDPAARADAFAEADVAILCLPDAAAIEAVAMAGDCRIIDASTAHRVADGWVYGMPELPGQAEAIAGASRVANVGCYATGFFTEETLEEGLGIVLRRQWHSVSGEGQCIGAKGVPGTR